MWGIFGKVTYILYHIRWCLIMSEMHCGKTIMTRKYKHYDIGHPAHWACKLHSVQIRYADKQNVGGQGGLSTTVVRNIKKKPTKKKRKNFPNECLNNVYVCLDMYICICVHF